MKTLEELQKENDQLIEASGKLAGTIEFLVTVLSECAKSGSELARAALETIIKKE